MGIIDRHEWTEKRIAFLKARLGRPDLTTEERAATEHELTELHADRPRWRRLLWPVRLPHEH